MVTQKLQMMIKKSRDPKAKEDLQKNIAWIVSCFHFHVSSRQSLLWNVFSIILPFSLNSRLVQRITFFFPIFQDNKIKSAPASSKNLETRILSEHKKIEREAARKGKMPFYLKKGPCTDAHPPSSEAVVQTL